MSKVIRVLVVLSMFLVVAFATLWGTLALWFKAPGPEALHWIAPVVFGLFGLGGLLAVLGQVHRRWGILFVALLVAVIGWWNTLTPPSDGDWAPDVARQATGRIDGDILTLENIRAFERRSADDFTEHWVTRSYDLSKLQSMDLFLSYWGGPAMAHFMLSFGFEGGGYLAWSIEVRRKADDRFAPLADFFKAHPISVIASEERDVVGLRSNIEKSDVRMFRLNTDPVGRRKMIEAYVEAANWVSQKPHWFNSVFTNCSRTAILLARNAGDDLPLDWRVIVNGYMPEYLYDLGVLDTSVPLDELIRLSSISEHARQAGLTDAYSEAIRQGVPKP
jgi:hypothetical protein